MTDATVSSPTTRDTTLKTVDFFVAGFARCGTTRLFKLLCQLPGVFPVDEKEPHFWGSDCRSTPKEKYRSLYESADGDVLLGDASTLTIYSGMAVDQILAENSADSKFILCIRDPAQTAFSMYSYAKYHGFEFADSFEAALADNDDRAKAAEARQFVAVTAYKERVRYGRQLKLLLDKVPRKNVHIVDFERFVNAPVNEFGEVCRFLGVANTLDETAFQERVNASRSIKHDAAHKLMQRLPRPMKLLSKLTGREMTTDIRGTLTRRFFSSNDKPTLSGATAQSLRQDLSDDVELLTELLDESPAWVSDYRH